MGGGRVTVIFFGKRARNQGRRGARLWSGISIAVATPRSSQALWWVCPIALALAGHDRLSDRAFREAAKPWRAEIEVTAESSSKMRRLGDFRGDKRLIDYPRTAGNLNFFNGKSEVMDRARMTSCRYR